MIEDAFEKVSGLSIPMLALVLLLVLTAIHQINKGHIGRVGIASAGVLVFTSAYPVWGSLQEVWRLYTILAGGFAIIAASSYMTKTSLPSEFYKIALVLYGGIPILLAWQFGFPL